MDADIAIRWAHNGFILQNVENGQLILVPYPDDNPVKGIVELLQLIVEELGLSGSRYDKERIHITIKKGDKYEGE